VRFSAPEIRETKYDWYSEGCRIAGYSFAGGIDVPGFCSHKEKTMKKMVVVFSMFFAAASVFTVGQKGGASTSANHPITHPRYGELPYTEIDWYEWRQVFPDSQMVYDAMNEYIKPIINAKVIIHTIPESEAPIRFPTTIWQPKANGLDKILAEAQRQADIFRTKK
jgi:hypothetical protein